MMTLGQKVRTSLYFELIPSQFKTFAATLALELFKLCLVVSGHRQSDIRVSHISGGMLAALSLP